MRCARERPTLCQEPTVSLSLKTLLLALASLPVALAGCGGDADSASDDITQADVAFSVLDVSRSHASAGVTLIKSSSDYRAFFDADPPADLSFNKSWVIHYSMGMEKTGGYATEVTRIQKTGTKGKYTLVVHTEDTSPGDACNVTQAITNPQITVRINKQTGTTKIAADVDAEVMDCGASGPIVEYRFGNQIFGSEVSIQADGVIDHGERTCCPPHTDTVTEKKLSAAKLEQLLAAIDAASHADTKVTEGGPTTEGSQSGILEVHTAAGDKIVIHDIERTTTVDSVEYNTAPEAAWIEALVAGIAEHDMPAPPQE